MSHLLKVFFICLVIYVCLGMGMVFVESQWKQKRQLHSILMKLSIFSFSLVTLFFILELFFYSFFIISDGFNITLGSKRWFQKYWKPINSFGYRDVEHEPNSFIGKEVIFVVGDSFVAGHGIEDPEDRFSNILQRKLSNSHVVVNIAKLGWQTEEEFNALRSYPYKPQRVIWCYYLNDIRGVADRLGYEFINVKKMSPVWMRNNPWLSDLCHYVLENSFAINFFFWRIYRMTDTDLGSWYRNYLQTLYSDGKIWEIHRKELIQLTSYARDQGVILWVIVFPELTDIQWSKTFTSKVVDLFRQYQVDVIDLASLLKNRKASQLVVNPFDCHANARLNNEIAEVLFEKLKSN